MFVAAVAATPSTVLDVVDDWGRGFWDLIPFTMQMALVIITGHVLATSRPMGRLIRAVASWPTNPRSAVALVAFFAMASSWLNWGFSLVYSAVLAIEVARRGRERALLIVPANGAGLDRLYPRALSEAAQGYPGIKGVLNAGRGSAIAGEVAGVFA